MPADALIPAASLADEYSAQLTAAAILFGSLVVAWLVNRVLARRGQRLAATMARGALTPVLDTRLRIVRRLIYAGIITFGVIGALSQFDTFTRLTNTLLASSVVAAAVVGFAARTVLASAIAGIVLAIAQPLRIGDLVTIEGEEGIVEDVRLTATYLRTGDHARIIVPNERIAQGILRNETIVDPLAEVAVWVWLPPHADADRAVEVLAPEAQDGTVRVAEVTPEGVRLTVTTGPVPAPQRPAREGDLRAACLRRLRGSGLLEGAASGTAEPSPPPS